ncbi:MAG TPA: hypothetical protein VE988_02735 [Gemmataceae bacterium]|nr:hypothetical protein [Gemmataceae bacterium]
MGRFILSAACFFAIIQAATAQVQQYTYRTTAIGCQRITDIIPVEALPPGKVIEGKSSPKLVTMTAKDWKDGTQFTDGSGKMWRTVYGPALQQNPDQLSGTLTTASDGKVLFLTGGGTLFMRVEQ